MNRLIKKFSCIIACLTALMVLTTGCSNHKFKVKGEIYGAENKSIAVEKSDFQGRWVVVDSIHVNKNGGFSFSFPTPPSPEIYRLNLNGKYIYFPVDSTETITLISSYDKFGRDFSLSGSPNAEKLALFEQDLFNTNTSHPDSLTNFKRQVFSKYMKDSPGSIINFYILTKIVDDKPLYNPADAADSKYFSAVATGYQLMNPDDPHAKLLEQTAIQALRQKNSEAGKYRELEAEEISIIDMDLQNEDGKYVKLSDVVGKGKPVVVIFSVLNHPDSPEFNIALANIYKSHSGNVEFYNVSLDADQYAWREAARNLPWITVYSPGQNGSQDAINYNVDRIPAFYLYNAKGELVSRPMTLEELRKSL